MGKCVVLLLFPTKIIFEKLAGYICPELALKMLKQFMHAVKTLLNVLTLLSKFDNSSLLHTQKACFDCLIQLVKSVADSFGVDQMSGN